MGIIKKIIGMIVELIKFAIGSLFIVVFAFLWLCSFALTSSASEEYKGVIEELKADPTFNIEDYPDKIDDYNLYVMQIAETSNKELILYVYQPSHIKYDLQATKISLSYGFSKDGKGLESKLYPLKLLDTEGVFDKYLVSNYEVPKDNYRYYNIVSIYRVFNSTIDGVQEDIYHDWADKAISVGQQWCAYDINNSVAYEMNTFDTMLIDTSITSHIEFNHGLTWGNFVGAFNKGDCWFIGFNCEDYVIKHIYDADMTYSEKSVIENWLLGKGSTYVYGEETIQTITLTNKDTMSYTGNGLGARTFEWNRILSACEFIENLETNKLTLTEEKKDILLRCQWVFTFTETPRSYLSYEGGYTNDYYDVYDVGILRLHFLDTSGMTYDLGVVNSLTDPNNKAFAVGGTKILETIGYFFQKLFAILGLVVLVLILMFFSNLLTPIITILKEIWKGIKYIFSIPFKILKWIFKRR